jgi:formylglycine-generating enzyme required for sulfatase activity
VVAARVRFSCPRLSVGRESIDGPFYGGCTLRQLALDRPIALLDPGKPYRLLSEAEWEYAARAGTMTRYFFGDDEKALCRYGNGGDETAKSKITGAQNWTVVPCSDGYAYTSPVGSFQPNSFGLYDMHGNAGQWTEDCYHEKYDGSPSDGSAWTSGDCTSRVLRGGSWNYRPRILRAAFRGGVTSVSRSNVNGFRLGRTLSP